MTTRKQGKQGETPQRKNSESETTAELSVNIGEDSTCLVCDETLLAVNDNINLVECAKCGLPAHVDCCMSNEVFQLLCKIKNAAKEVVSGTISYHCGRCTEDKENSNGKKKELAIDPAVTPSIDSPAPNFTANAAAPFHQCWRFRQSYFILWN